MHVYPMRRKAPCFRAGSSHISPNPKRHNEHSRTAGALIGEEEAGKTLDEAEETNDIKPIAVFEVAMALASSSKQ